MSPQPSPPRDACPHCGKSVGVRWRHLLPSGARNRTFKCPHCAGLYDFSETCRMASVIGGLVGMFPSILLFGVIVKAGGNTRLSVFGATVIVALGFGLTSVLASWLTLRLVPKR